MIKDIVVIALLLIILGIILGWYVYFCFVLFSKSRKAPYISSFGRQLQIMGEHLHLKPNTTMVDLGCGDGKALRFFLKKYKLKSCEGFDIHWFAIRLGRLLNRIKKIKNVHLYNKNLFKADLKKYDYIYIYLWPSQLAFMEDRVFSTMKKDAIIISNSFVFAKHKPFQVVKNKWGKDAIFLYKNQ